jgi:hypothetical protein
MACSHGLLLFFLLMVATACRWDQFPGLLQLSVAVHLHFPWNILSI